MLDLTEDTLAPDVVVRRAPSTTLDIRHGDAGDAPLVGLSSGALWARAEPAGPGVDVGHGTLNVVVRGGTVLLDAQGGAGLMIVLRGEAEISTGGQVLRTACAGQAVPFDSSGTVGDADPVDAAELAHDPFISLNLVLDSLGGVPVTLDHLSDPAPALVGGGAAGADDAAGDRRRGRRGGPPQAPLRGPQEVIC